MARRVCIRDVGVPMVPAPSPSPSVFPESITGRTTGPGTGLESGEAEPGPQNADMQACLHASLLTQLCSNFPIPCAAACQAFLSMECSRQEYWSGLPFPVPQNEDIQPETEKGSVK